MFAAAVRLGWRRRRLRVCRDVRIVGGCIVRVFISPTPLDRGRWTGDNCESETILSR